MKQKHNAGFSLVEVLVAIVLLGTLVVPICSSLVLTFRMNEKTDAMLQAKLAVSSAAETLMAEGIDEQALRTKLDNFNEYQAQQEPFDLPVEDGEGRFPGVSVYVSVIPYDFFTVEGNRNYYTSTYDCYTVEIISNADDSVRVTTQIREKEAAE